MNKSPRVKVLSEVTGFNYHTKKPCKFSIKILFSENETPQWEYRVYTRVPEWKYLHLL